MNVMPVRACNPGFVRPSNAEAFSTATFAGDVWITETKCLVEPFLDKVDLGAVDEREAVRIYNDLDAAVFENDVNIINLICIVDNVGKAVTAGFLDADTQAYAAAPGVEVGPDPLSGRFSQ